MTDYPLVPLAVLAFPDIDPVVVQLGPVAIHWYGLGYVVAILFCWWYARRLIANRLLWAGATPPMRAVDIDDLVLWAAIGVVAGGRLGYVLFYDLARYLDNPLAIVALWQGGMSFHGGLVGTVVAMALFARSRGINVWSLLDVVAPGIPVGLGLVRCANFINAELWGRPADVPWAFVFPGAGPEPRHPSQLYEALLEGLVLFVVLRLLTHSWLKLKTPGFVCGAFVCGYGLARILVEFFRMPDAHIGYLLGGWLTMGMILSLPMVLVGAWAMASARSAVPAGSER